MDETKVTSEALATASEVVPRSTGSGRVQGTSWADANVSQMSHADFAARLRRLDARCASASGLDITATGLCAVLRDAAHRIDTIDRVLPALREINLLACYTQEDASPETREVMLQTIGKVARLAIDAATSPETAVERWRKAVGR